MAILPITYCLQYLFYLYLSVDFPVKKEREYIPDRISEPETQSYTESSILGKIAELINS